jgi:hypothetical protein
MLLFNSSPVRRFELTNGHLVLLSKSAHSCSAYRVYVHQEESRQLAQLYVKASHKQAKEFRELAQQAREKYSRAHSFLAINRLYDWYQRSGTPKSFDGI